MDVAPIKPTFRTRSARYRGWLEGVRLQVLKIATGLLMLGLVAGLYLELNMGLVYLLAAVILLSIQLLLWWRLYLEPLPPGGSLDSDTIDPNRSADYILLAEARKADNPQQLWQGLSGQWPARFITNRLLVDTAGITAGLSDRPEDMPDLWRRAHGLSLAMGAKTITGGAMSAALILSRPDVDNWLRTYKLAVEDVTSVLFWQYRTDEVYYKLQQKRLFGGFGRDWAAGYTPLLNRFGTDISRQVEYGAYQHIYLQTHSSDLDRMLNVLSQTSHNSLALVGKTGVGKTSLVYALAERLLDPKNKQLKYYKVFSLNAAAIVSEANRSGNLESLLIHLIAEARGAGNVILFFDDAASFLSTETGAADMTGILTQVISRSAVRMVFALTPGDWQHLLSTTPDVATSLQQLQVTEPDRETVERVLQDQSLAIEAEKKVSISHSAVKEAASLAERYLPDQAFPGKAISLLDTAAGVNPGAWVTQETVQQAVESMTGAKVTAAQSSERDVLLNLEQHLHQYMINQSFAVGVVADALRRSRAKVSSNQRPVGSFLFLGPTGVGKTELSKALARVYFGGQDQIVRLDMSEYNSSESTQRLLAPAGNQGTFLTAIRNAPSSVVLLDEVEKASEEVLNLLLQLLDEGALTDVEGRAVSFKDAIIITTSNAGADLIRANIEAGQNLEDFSDGFIDQLISDRHFKPELINRFDEVVLFRPLDKEELLQVVDLLLAEVNSNLEAQKITVSLTDAAKKAMVDQGYDPRLGARPMRRVMQRTVENIVSKRLLSGELQPGDSLSLDASELRG